ncbi:M16 family metallopeptidase [Zhouia amylolytica]|uniref:M16 family metallopeptidase n=1 Tax=Zhouia amylolytica TaxID=376730 RepID=UPI0020CD0E6F|nr:M16 family metallopeptidase [Zhouia amylolytica]MCQ0110568.1 insulinase family protein [Zhouia amylolytica]
MRTFTLGLFMLFIVFSIPVQSQDVVPFDTSIRKGVLSNGMHYYIKHNEEPKERASFYFAQNVGSVLEKETQRGLAHFLEHMAFNGTEHYPEKTMLEYLEKNGIKFGSEINAFTSFDKTVYNISKVPVTNPRLIDSTLLVLHDWSGNLSLTDEEIDAERGVINEEWRTRNTPGFRVSERIWTEAVLAGSVYSKRMPIGLMSVVNNFEYDELRDYYKRWYRPDQQAVIVVGDIDVDEMEARIKTLFSTIPLKKNLPVRPEFDIEFDGGTKFMTSTDKEIGTVGIQFYVRNKAKDLKEFEYVDNGIKKSLVSYILNNRYREMTVKPECPALSAGYSYSNFVRPLDILGLSIQPKTGKELESFEFALTELLRFVKFGATESELERAKKSIKNSQLSRLKNKDKISSDSYANSIYSYFFSKDPMPDIDWSVNYLVERLATISNEDLINHVASQYKKEDLVIAVTGPEDKEYPTREAFLEVYDKVHKSDLSPFEDTTSDEPLIAEDLKEQAVVKTEKLSGIDANMYTLSNGAKVVIYPTTYDKDVIYIKGYSPGGTSLLDKEMLPSSNAVTYVASQSGLGNFNKIDLGKKLAGTNTSLGMGLGELSESVSGRSTKSDIEVLFKKLYLSFEAPRFEQEAFDLAIERFKKGIEQKKKNKKSTLQDSISLALSNHNERTLIFDEELLTEINFNKIQEIYKDRFNGVDDFTFVFVGDIDEAHVLKLAQKYIGNIKASGAKESYVDHEYNPAKGKTTVRVKEDMETPQTTVRVIFNGELSYNLKNGLVVNMVGELLKKSCHEVIREEEGGSYGVGASGSLTDIPDERYTVSVGFDCNPDKTDQLIAVVYDELEKMTTAVNLDDLNEVKKSFIKSRTEAVNNNGYWMNVITSNVFYGRKVYSLDEYIALVNAITEKDIKKAAGTIVKKSDIVEGVLVPKN